MRGRDIRARRVRRAPAIVKEMSLPTLDESASGMIDQFSQVDQPPTDDSAKAATKEHQQFGSMARVEILLRALAERDQAAPEAAARIRCG